MTPFAVPQEAELVLAPDGRVLEADEAAVRLLGPCRGRPFAEVVETSEDVLTELLGDFRRSTSPVPGRLRLRTTRRSSTIARSGSRPRYSQYSR